MGGKKNGKHIHMLTIMLLQYIYIGLFEWELYVDRIYRTILVNIHD